jgi:hypothetical protein
MRPPVRLSLPLSILAAGWLAGCQSGPTAPRSEANPAPVPADARQQAYARELLALKATGADQRTWEAKHLELLSKYGYPLPEAGTGAGPAPSARPAPDAYALAKAASTRKYVLVRQASGSIYRTYQDEVNVPAGAKLTLQVHAQGAADPYVIAYYHPAAGGVRYLLHDDDFTASSLDAYGEWQNASQSDLRVTYTVFAALTTARGLGDLTVAIDGGGVHTLQLIPGIRVGGTVQWGDDFANVAPSGCQDPAVLSRFDFGVNTGSNQAQILAYSAFTLTGVDGTADVNGITLYSDPIPPGFPKTFPAHGSFVLASRASTFYGYATISGGYTYYQYDQFPCP